MTPVLLCEVFVLVLGRRLGAGRGVQTRPIPGQYWLPRICPWRRYPQPEKEKLCDHFLEGKSPALSKQNSNLQTSGGDKPEAEFTGYNAWNLPALYKHAMVSTGLEIL